jgi:hypothetical protein
MLADERSRTAVQVAARFADGLATDDELIQAWEKAQAAHEQEQDHDAGDAAEAVVAASSPSVNTSCLAADNALMASGYTVRRAQHALLAELLGNPFRPISINPCWLLWNDGTIPKIARAAYDEPDRPGDLLDPTRLSILADALEEAGCDNKGILDHCRSAGNHVRGCWVVDLLLGKE